MPVRYDQDTRATAIGLVREHAGDYPSEHAAIAAAARRLGMTPETPRKWARDEYRCKILSVMAHGHLMLAVIPGVPGHSGPGWSCQPRE